MIKCGKMLSVCHLPLSRKNIEDFAIGCYVGLSELHVVIYGFIYEKGRGIYVVGPEEELERVRAPEMKIEPFDFEEYINTTDDTFWVVDYLAEGGPSLKRMEK